MQKVPAHGTEAPDFEIPAREGLRLALSDYRGEYVVVLFYPVEHFVKFRAFSERCVTCGHCGEEA